MRLGPMELGLILVLVLILFGAGRLPQVFSQFGKAVKNFKDAQKDDDIDVSPPPAPKQLDAHLDDAQEARVRETEKHHS